MPNCERKVGAFESEFEYNPDWGGPAPVLWLPAGWRPNKSNKTAFGRGPRKRRGTWAGSTTRRNVVTDRGRAWTFNGSNDYLDIGGGFIETDAGTFAVWLEAHTQVSASTKYVMAARTPGTDSRIYIWVNGNTHDLGWGWADDHASMTHDNNVENDGKWHLAVLTWANNGASVKAYLDGAQVQSDTGALAGAPTNFRLGSYAEAAPGDYFAGKIRDAVVYNQALTASHIRLLYESSLDGSPSMAQPIGRMSFPAAVAAGVTAPTAVLDGPLVGPLGGPV